MNDKSVQAIGMGHNGIATEKRRLKVATLTVYSTEKCRKLYGSNRDFVKEMMICAFSPEADTCKGDSGGSIFYKEPNTKSWIILGITSKIMGKSCDGQNIRKTPKISKIYFLHLQNCEQNFWRENSNNCYWLCELYFWRENSNIFT